MTRICAIVNITPDSFSGDGHMRNNDRVLEVAEKALESGVEMIDIGAQSTRPGAEMVGSSEEMSRLSDILPAMCALCASYGASLSVDTCSADVAAYAISCGADIINDVSAAIMEGGRDNEEMLSLLRAQPQITYIFMHHICIPADKSQHMPLDCDILEELLSWRDARIQIFNQAGIATDRLIFDPGLGFGKTSAQSMELLRKTKDICDGTIPVMVGHSRKSFLGDISGTKHAGDRDAETLAASCYATKAGADWLRVHNGKDHMNAMRILKSLEGDI